MCLPFWLLWITLLWTWVYKYPFLLSFFGVYTHLKFSNITFSVSHTSHPVRVYVSNKSVTKHYLLWHWHFLFLVFFFFNACQTTQIHFCQPRFTKHSKDYWPTNEILLITCAEGVREEKDMVCRSLPSLYPQLFTDEGELFQPPHSLEREFFLPTLQGRKPGLSKDLPPRSLSAVGPLSGPPCPTG